jgi:hypothetical protein
MTITRDTIVFGAAAGAIFEFHSERLLLQKKED